MADLDRLGRLERRADAVAESASSLISRAMREIKGEIANLSGELNLAGSAADRDKVYQMIQRRMAKASRRIDALMQAQNEVAAKYAARSAASMTGCEVKYSAQRATAITELVTPAQSENLAAVFTERMSDHLINSLRGAVVETMRQQAVEGGSLKSTGKTLLEKWQDIAGTEKPVFTDASGREWDTKQYIQMNTRTTAMRVYNDCLADNIERATGSDLARISTGGDPDCECAAWEGQIISLSGATKGFPTYEQAREGGCFHPNCTHTLEYIDEVADKDEIDLQKAHPVGDDPTDYDQQDERKYQIDIDRKVRDTGCTKDEARVAVDRDNLTEQIRFGLVRNDAKSIVAAMTDAQVTALCPNGNPPAFDPFMPTKQELADGAKERWNHGRYGGVVHIKKNATVDDILDVCRVRDAKPEAIDVKAKVVEAKPTEWEPKTEIEKSTHSIMQSIGAKRFANGESADLKDVNPEYALSRTAMGYGTFDEIKAARAELKKRGLLSNAFAYNCQRCVPTMEAIRRGYKVKAMPYDAGQHGDDLSWGCNVTSMFKCDMFTDRIHLNGSGMRSAVEDQMSKWGDGARAEIRVAWKGARGSGHVFFAEQVNGKTVYIDPQSGRSDDHVEGYFGKITTSGCYKDYHWIMRIDDKEFTDVAKRCFEPA